LIFSHQPERALLAPRAIPCSRGAFFLRPFCHLVCHAGLVSLASALTASESAADIWDDDRLRQRVYVHVGYADASLADSAAAIGHTADNAVPNAVDGMTLGYGDKIAAGLDALTGRSPDYASALAAERAQSTRAMARSPRGVGTARVKSRAWRCQPTR
jgi:hypothetical protein